MGERTRNRSFNTPYVNPEAFQVLASDGSIYATLPGFMTVSNVTVETMMDVVTSDYFRRSNNGEIINSDMNQVKDVKQYAKFSVDMERRVGSLIYRTNGTMCDPNLPLLTLPAVPSEDAGLISQAVTEAHADVNVRDVDLTVMAAELGESVRLIHDIGHRFLKIYKAFRKFNLKAMRGLISPKEVRNVWLEYRYGIRPLYYDLKGIHKYLQRHGEVAKRYTARSNPKSETSSGKSVGSYTVETPLNTGNFLPFTTSYERWTEQNISVRAGVLYAVEFSSALAKQLALLGIDRPLSSGWDLIPFSFIVDWFVGIGPFIASWEPKPGCNTLASWTVCCREARSVTHVTSIIPKSGITGWSNFSVTSLNDITRVSRIVDRKANPSLPPLPTSALKLNAAKLLDLAAIFLRFK